MKAVTRCASTVSVDCASFAQDAFSSDAESILQPGRGAAPAGELASAAEALHAADGYYFRGIARLQRLWEVTVGLVPSYLLGLTCLTTGSFSLTFAYLTQKVVVNRQLLCRRARRPMQTSPRQRRSVARGAASIFCTYSGASAPC